MIGAAACSASVRERAKACLRAVSIALAVFCSSKVFADDQAQPWRIVMLYGSDYMLPAVVMHNQALQRALEAGSPRRIDFYSDAVDAQRFDGSDLEAAFLALMRRKYSSTRVDLVVAGNQFAHDFAQRHRAELWPDARLLLHNSPDHILRDRQLAPGDLAVPIRFDFDGTIQLATRLQPDARRLVIVGGVSDRDRLWRRGIAEAAARRVPPLDVVEIADAPLPQILDDLKRLPRDSIVYYGTMFRDAVGNGYVPRDVALAIASASAAPVYSHVGTYLGRGIVGGALTDDDAEGGRIGALILAMLEMTPIPGGPMLPAAPGTCTVDWREATRWNLSLDGLPAECTIAFRPASIWQMYGPYIATAIAVMAMQALLIGALILQLRRRRQAEREVAQRLRELAQATRLATLGELTAAISHEVNQPLGAILSNADAAEMLLEAGEPRLDEVRDILAVIRREDLRASRVVSRVRALLTKRPLEMKSFALDTLIADTLAIVRFEAERSSITLNATGERLQVNGDPVQLQQVLLNLLINAMEAVRDLPAARRRIHVRTSVDAAGTIEVSVADDGPGIPTERIDKVFDSFFTSKADGIGLGLSLARTIVEAHGGRIRVENALAGGATFVVTLPTATAAATEDPIPAPPARLGSAAAQGQP